MLQLYAVAYTMFRIRDILGLGYFETGLRMRVKFEEEIKKEKRKKIIKECIIWLVEILAVIGIAYFVIHVCFAKICTIGSSMEPTLFNGEDVFLNTKAYMIFSPKREDVVAFYDREVIAEEGEEPLIRFRRVIGLPGERIQIVENKILINGEEWVSEHEYEPMLTAGVAEQEIKLGKDEYFVLCDARVDADDSRNASFGNIKREEIIGKVSFRYKPFSRVTGPKVNPKETEAPK